MRHKGQLRDYCKRSLFPVGSGIKEPWKQFKPNSSSPQQYTADHPSLENKPYVFMLDIFPQISGFSRHLEFTFIYDFALKILNYEKLIILRELYEICWSKVTWKLVETLGVLMMGRTMKKRASSCIQDRDIWYSYSWKSASSVHSLDCSWSFSNYIEKFMQMTEQN